MPPRSASRRLIIRDAISASGSTSPDAVHDLRQILGRVLAVAVQQDDEVEALLDRVQVAELLVAAVAAVEWSAEDRDVGEAESAAGCRAFSNVRSLDESSMTRISANRSRSCCGIRSRTLGDEPLGLEGDDEDRDTLLLQHFFGGCDRFLVDVEPRARGLQRRSLFDSMSNHIANSVNCEPEISNSAIRTTVPTLTS